MHEFAREERLPSYFMNRLQDFLSSARTDLRLTRKNNTEVEVAPVEPYGIAGIDLQGLWRFRDTAVSRVHPGGGAATYTVWAVGLKQDVVEVPKPFTDETDYSFDLRITNGANPAGAGVEVFEKIGEIDWDGVKITAVRQTYNAVTGPMLQDGALSNSGDIEWTREANGAWVPQLKAASVAANEILDGSVGAAEVADALKPSAGAAAGTEALRALGTTASTAAAGNDSRLTDERTPKNSSVTEGKIATAFREAANLALANSYTNTAIASPLPAPTTLFVALEAGAAEVKGITQNNNARFVIYRVNTGVATTFKHNVAGEAEPRRMRLKGGVDFAATAADVIGFIWFGMWYECFRSENV